MKAVSVLILSLLALTFGVLLRQERREYAYIISVGVSVIIAVFAFSYLHEITDYLKTVAENGNVSFKYITPCLKAIGIGYITEFASSLLEEEGFLSIKTQVVFFGRCLIFITALPLIKELFNLAVSLL